MILTGEKINEAIKICNAVGLTPGHLSIKKEALAKWLVEEGEFTSEEEALCYLDSLVNNPYVTLW